MPNDPSTAPIYGLLQELGIQPGRDLGLIDDHSYASLLGITSVGQPLTQIGVTAARLLADAVRDGPDSVQSVVRYPVEARPPRYAVRPCLNGRNTRSERAPVNDLPSGRPRCG